MKKIRHTETGFAFDERNKRDYDALTRRIEKALADIEIDLANFKSKPTQKYLARKAKCSVETLIHRSKRNENESGCGQSNTNNYGWPLSEIKRIQEVHKSLKQKKYETTTSNSCKIQELAKQDVAITKSDNVSLVLSNMRGQNAHLFMENEDLKSKLRNAELSLYRVENTCAALKEENCTLYHRIKELQDELRKQSKSKLTIVKKGKCVINDN